MSSEGGAGLREEACTGPKRGSYRPPVSVSFASDLGLGSGFCDMVPWLARRSPLHQLSACTHGPCRTLYTVPFLLGNISSRETVLNTQLSLFLENSTPSFLEGLL